MSAAMSSACASVDAIPLTGCFRPSRCTSCWNRWRSSARSMASGVVPRIGMPACDSALASFSGVWPPNCTMTPCSVPLSCSTRRISITCSNVSGSKYSRSDVS